MIHNTRKKIHVGSVIGRCKYVVMKSKVIDFWHKVSENIEDLSFISLKCYTFALIFQRTYCFKVYKSGFIQEIILINIIK